MTFAEQNRYNRLFKQVIHKGGKPVINFIKIFQNAKALAISVRNSYSEDQLMHTFFRKIPERRETLCPDIKASIIIEDRSKQKLIKKLCLNMP